MTDYAEPNASQLVTYELRRLNENYHRLASAVGRVELCQMGEDVAHQLPIFRLITEHDFDIRVWEIVRDLKRPRDDYRVREIGLDGEVLSVKWTNACDAQRKIDELLLRADRGDLGQCSWVLAGSNVS